MVKSKGGEAMYAKGTSREIEDTMIREATTTRTNV